MNALLKEYRFWRDEQIKQAFDEPVADADALKEYVLCSIQVFYYDYIDSITLRQYRMAQEELSKRISCEDIVDNTLVYWCQEAISDDDWDKLFNDHEPETESERVEAFSIEELNSIVNSHENFKKVKPQV